MQHGSMEGFLWIFSHPPPISSVKVTALGFGQYNSMEKSEYCTNQLSITQPDPSNKTN